MRQTCVQRRIKSTLYPHTYFEHLLARKPQQQESWAEGFYVVEGRASVGFRLPALANAAVIHGWITHFFRSCSLHHASRPSAHRLDQAALTNLVTEPHTGCLKL